jgi:pimeloyl-ACP methyl ester carboxylesterase
VPLIDPDRVIEAPGPWTHRQVSANGARFHVVELGEGPAVLLMHGFPTFWWTWRNQLTALANAGYRAIAMDLRGYGGSDHPPHGYDPTTQTADAAGVLRSLGVPSAYVIGHGWGAFGAWAMGVLEPDAVLGIIPIAMPHPRAMRSNLLRAGQWTTLGYMLNFQMPLLPERSLRRLEGHRVEELMRRWSASTDWIDTEGEVYRSAFMRWPTAHTSIEYHRWAVRSFWRTDGLRFMSAMSEPITTDVLHIHGVLDPMVLSASCSGSGGYVSGSYRFAALQTGHFPQEEAPAEVSALIIEWLNERSRS